jgi:hypothetical protein
MFPGLRLIAVSFLCGFVVVFIGLRAVFSLNNVHSSLPVMAAQAAQSVPPGMIEPRGAPSAMPTLYDFRLVASAVTPQFDSLMVPTVKHVPPDPARLVEDAFKEAPSATLADAPAPQADDVHERQAAIAAEPTRIEPPAATPPVEPPAAAPAELSFATPAEPQPTSDSPASEPAPPELVLQPISLPTAPLESRAAMIGTDPDAAAAAVEAPKPTKAKLTKVAAKPVRKKNARVARRVPPQNGFSNPSGNSFGNPGGNSFGNPGGNSFGNAGRNSFGNPAANSSGNRSN